MRSKPKRWKPKKNQILTKIEEIRAERSTSRRSVTKKMKVKVKIDPKSADKRSGTRSAPILAAAGRSAMKECAGRREMARRREMLGAMKREEVRRSEKKIEG